jgi:hypothetical protein
MTEQTALAIRQQATTLTPHTWDMITIRRAGNARGA